MFSWQGSLSSEKMLSLRFTGLAVMPRPRSWFLRLPVVVIKVDEELHHGPAFVLSLLGTEVHDVEGGFHRLEWDASELRSVGGWHELQGRLVLHGLAVGLALVRPQGIATRVLLGPGPLRSARDRRRQLVIGRAGSFLSDAMRLLLHSDGAVPAVAASHLHIFPSISIFPSMVSCADFSVMVSSQEGLYGP